MRQSLTHKLTTSRHGMCPAPCTSFCQVWQLYYGSAHARLQPRQVCKEHEPQSLWKAGEGLTLDVHILEQRVLGDGVAPRLADGHPQDRGVHVRDGQAQPGQIAAQL